MAMFLSNGIDCIDFLFVSLCYKVLHSISVRTHVFFIFPPAPFAFGRVLLSEERANFGISISFFILFMYSLRKL